MNANPAPAGSDSPTDAWTKPILTLGIGASAGGVEALELFFDRMTPNSGLAIVVIQHLSPDFNSLMDEILARHTTMPVLFAEDGMPVSANHVYVNAPGKEISIQDGRLRVGDKSANMIRPIDHFLRSLAADSGAKCGAIILSGTGTDGAAGVGFVKRAGGLVLVQEPTSAQFNGMPLAALATGHVDVTLAPDRMPAMVLSLIFQEGIVSGGPPLTTPRALWPVFPLLRDAYGIDFAEYKIPTLARRTERRMKALGCDDITQYAARLGTDPAELDALYHDLLIGVTSFFRDPDAFERLATVWLPDVLQRLEAGEEFRAWVAGCATGEEAYSLAIVVREALDAVGLSNVARIFATDVHRDALRHAAVGVYDASRLEHIPEHRRERYFIKKDGQWQIHPDIRSMIVFAPHDLLRDVPFNRLDLVSCRNLLIYLENNAQHRALSTFHFALKTKGLLLLGPSESLADLGSAFETIDTHWKVFRRKGDVRVAPLSSFHPPILRPHTTAPLPVQLPHPSDATLHAVLATVMPAAVLVGKGGNLVQTFGGASRFLRVPEGRATNDIGAMVGADLRVAITGALGRIANEPGPIHYRDIATGVNPGARVDITVRQIRGFGGGEPHALISFEDEREAPQEETGKAIVAPDQMALDRISALETELRHARDNLQSTIEALETSNEELQAANEELMASNEELQTTNEELHSVNQELFTVNTEYQKKITELTQLTSDMDHLLVSTEVHTLFLDGDLCVRRFTPKMGEVFNLVESDIGRRIDAFNHTLNLSGLYDDLRHVLTAGKPFEVQVQGEDGAWFLLRALPYRQKASTASDGVVVTLVDISGMKRLEAEARNKSDLLKNILTNSPHPVFVRDKEGKYVVVDESFRRLTGRDPTGLRPREIFSVDVAAMLTQHDDRILSEGMSIESEDTIPTPEGPRTYLSVRFPMRSSDGEIIGIGGMKTDVTNLKRAEAEARQASARRDRFLATLSHELRNPLAAVLNTARILVRSERTSEADLERWHRVILERAEHMTRLVDDLLDVARLTQDKLVLQRESMDLRAAAKGVIDEVSGLFQDNGITLTANLDGELRMLGDATRLHQLQVNLLTNAARHTPPGGNVTFRLQRSGEAAEIAVIDDGEGIAPDMLERIFDLFVQGDRPGARGTDHGLGVGLALVRRIAELHGGNVTVASRGRGKGTEFRVRLPLVVHRPSSMPPSAPAQQSISEQPGHVLVVDDDKGSLEAMQGLLEMDDIEVTPAMEGSTALELLANGLSPDLILLDIGLPGMDGYEVCRRMRALPRGNQLLIFALTGFGQDSDREAATNAGFDGHLTKPVDVDDVYALYASKVSE